MSVKTMKEIVNGHKPTIQKQVNYEVEVFDIRKQQKQEKINEYKRISVVNKKTESQTFENAIVKNKKEQEYKRSFETYCNKFAELKNQAFGMILMGNAGTGKTFYSSCIYNALCNDYKVYKTSIYHFFQRIKQTFENPQNATDMSIFKEILDADLIILDDVGNEYISEKWGNEKLAVMFDLIYENEKSLIITTNFDEENLTKFLDIKGSNKIVDKLSEVCKTYIFDWESRRKEIREEKFKGKF